MGKMTEVLIVEDSEDVLWTLGNMLDYAGFIVEGVTAGEEALTKMRECPEIKLIILDYILPDMSGLTVLKRLREAGSQVKVIATSVLQETRESFVNAGVLAFLEKPFNISKFIDLCKQVLNGENGQQGIASQN